MNKNTAVIILIVVAIGAVVSGFFVYRQLGGKSPVVPSERRAAGERNYISEANIDSRSFFFSPDVLEVRVGEKVTLNINASGNHTFVIDELGVDVETPNGQITKVELTPTRKGIFKFYCSVPGHREAGQEGTLVVN